MCAEINESCSLPCGTFTAAIAASSEPNPWEASTMLLDRKKDTKWLGVVDEDARAVVTLSADSPQRVTAYALSTANDAPERDPIQWILEGSLNGSAWRSLIYCPE